jgi:hypothetical protein
MGKTESGFSGLNPTGPRNDTAANPAPLRIPRGFESDTVVNLTPSRI